MSAEGYLFEQEFNALYAYLAQELPKLFNSHHASAPYFEVSPEIDQDPIASFLMTYDEFNQDIPRAIQHFLASLRNDWMVFGSFSIRDPFGPDGSVIRSPRFIVTKTSVSGDTDMVALANAWGNRLVAANEGREN